MLNCGPETSVTDWVIDAPAALAVFQQLGIDYSCGGVSLEYACRQRGLHVSSVLDQIQMAEHRRLMRRDFSEGSRAMPDHDGSRS